MSGAWKVLQLNSSDAWSRRVISISLQFVDFGKVSLKEMVAALISILSISQKSRLSVNLE